MQSVTWNSGHLVGAPSPLTYAVAHSKGFESRAGTNLNISEDAPSGNIGTKCMKTNNFRIFIIGRVLTY